MKIKSLLVVAVVAFSMLLTMGVVNGQQVQSGHGGVPVGLSAGGSPLDPGGELATLVYGLQLKGLLIPGLPAGAGDRAITATLYLPAADLTFANEMWYKHLAVLLGPDNLRAYAAAAGVQLP